MPLPQAYGELLGLWELALVHSSKAALVFGRAIKESGPMQHPTDQLLLEAKVLATLGACRCYNAPADTTAAAAAAADTTPATSATLVSDARTGPHELSASTNQTSRKQRSLGTERGGTAVGEHEGGEEHEQGGLTELAAAERDLRRAVVGDIHNGLQHPTRSSLQRSTRSSLQHPNRSSLQHPTRSSLQLSSAFRGFYCLHVGLLLARRFIACTWVYCLHVGLLLVRVGHVRPGSLTEGPAAGAAHH
jgi:hypothetical protein